MSEKMNTRAMLLSDSPWKLVAKLSVPAIVGMVVVGLYNFMDGVYVGQMIGDRAMAAVSVSYPFTLANTGISTLIGVGSASVLSRAIGKKDQAVIDKIMGNLIALNLIFSLIIMAGGMIFTKRILMLSGAKGEILSLATRYLRIIFAGSLFVNFAQSANMIMRGEGLLKRAMMFSAGSAVMNIILDPVFILLLNPYGRGIDGAAYATILSQVAYAAATLWYFKKKSRAVRIQAIRIEKDLFHEIIGVGVSAMLMQVMMLVQQTVLYNLAAQHGGDTWQIILGATYRVVSFAFIPLWGLSQGYQPAVGTNYGAKQYDQNFFHSSNLAGTHFLFADYDCTQSDPIHVYNNSFCGRTGSGGISPVFYILYPVRLLDCGPDSDAVPGQGHEGKCIGDPAPDCPLYSCCNYYAACGWTGGTWYIHSTGDHGYDCIDRSNQDGGKRI